MPNQDTEDMSRDCIDDPVEASSHVVHCSAKMSPAGGDAVALLTDFCVDNPQLDALSATLAELNIFEAAGMRQDELKHSRFLSFLLDPRESHGLGDAFLTRLLQKSIHDSRRDDLCVRRIDLELWDMTDSEVRTEWSGIDILVLDHTHRLAVVIENKVGSKEHSNQLKRYMTTIDQHFPGWKVLPLFLSPSGVAPTDDRFVAVTYELVVAIVEHFVSTRSSSLSAAMQTVLTHYTQLLRRHVVSDSAVKDLCQEIYRKHRRALDLLFEYRQDRWEVLRAAAAAYVGIGGMFELTADRPSLVRFIPRSWQGWLPLSDDTSWSKEGWPLLFSFDFNEKAVYLRLDIGPCDREIAKTFLDAALANRPPFNPQSKVVNQKWNRIYRAPMVTGAALSSGDESRIAAELQSGWHPFRGPDFDGMEQVLKDAAGSLDV